MVLNIDIAPTIAGLAGAATGPVDGESIAPLLEGSPDWRSSFLIENFVDFLVQAVRQPKREIGRFCHEAHEEQEGVFSLATPAAWQASW